MSGEIENLQIVRPMLLAKRQQKQREVDRLVKLPIQWLKSRPYGIPEEKQVVAVIFYMILLE